MGKCTGLYPSVQADAAAVGVVFQAGGVALTEKTVRDGCRPSGRRR